MAKNGRGHPTASKTAKNSKVRFSLSFPSKLLVEIERDVDAEDRSAKITKCAKLGYIQLMGRQQQ